MRAARLAVTAGMLPAGVGTGMVISELAKMERWVHLGIAVFVAAYLLMLYTLVQFNRS